MKSNTIGHSLQVLALLGGLFGLYITISSQFVKAETFREFKEGTVQQILIRLDKIDDKLDKLLEKQGK
jgi:hypothetical protein